MINNTRDKPNSGNKKKGEEVYTQKKGNITKKLNKKRN